MPGASTGYQKHLLSLKVMTSQAEQELWSFAGGFQGWHDGYATGMLCLLVWKKILVSLFWSQKEKMLGVTRLGVISGMN